MRQSTVPSSIHMRADPENSIAVPRLDQQSHASRSIRDGKLLSVSGLCHAWQVREVCLSSSAVILQIDKKARHTIIQSWLSSEFWMSLARWLCQVVAMCSELAALSVFHQVKKLGACIMLNVA